MFIFLDVNPYAIGKFTGNNILWAGVVCFGEN